MSKIVIHCSDPGNGPDTEDANLWKHIKAYIIPAHQRWVPIGLLGGPISLARPRDLPIDYAFLLGQINFALLQPRFNLQGFVVVGHDCGYYGRIARCTFTLQDKRDDLVTAARALTEEFGKPTLAYFKKAEKGFDQLEV